MLQAVLDKMKDYGYTPASSSGNGKWFNLYDEDSRTGCIVEEAEDGHVTLQFHFSLPQLTVKGNKIGYQHCLSESKAFHVAMMAIIQARELFD